MDPLSITAGTLAIVGAVDASYKCLRKFAAIRKAPAELAELRSEAKDLHTVLLLVAEEYDEDEDEVGGSGQQASAQEPRGLNAGTPKLKQVIQATLERHAERAALALDELNCIVCDYSAGLQGGKKLAGGIKAFYWAQNGRKKAVKLRQQLHEIRLNIITTLGAKSSAGIGRVEQILHDRLPVEPGIFSPTTDDIHITIEHPGGTPTSLADGSVPVDRHLSTIQDTQPPAYTALPEAASDMTKKLVKQRSCAAAPPPRALTRAPAGTIAAAVATAMHNSCVAWCSCSCHARGYVRSPTMLDPIFGNVSVAYGGVLSAARPCNEYSCRRRSTKAMKLNYRPPTWLYSHLFQLSMVSTPLYGLKLDLHFPRTIDWDAPIWAFAMDGNVDAIQDLFSRGVASPRDVNPIGGSMLHYAADHKRFELCKLLLNEGADPEHQDDCKRNPSVLAWDHVLSKKLSPDQEYVVGSLFKDSDYLETQGFTQIHKTILNLVPRDLATELGCSTAEINVPDANGRTPLAWAARRGDISSVQLLLSFGARVDIADAQGFLPIHEAINVACARALLTKDADAMSRNAWGRTPLHQVCDRGDDVILIDLLVSSGADVNAADATGEVALHTAIVHESIKHANNGHAVYMIRAGADSAVTNLSGDSPLRFAIMFNTHDILQEILRRPFSFTDKKHIFGHTFAHSIARTADAKTLGILQSVAVDIDLDLTTADKAGKTAMDYARERSDDPAMAVAFEKFANAVIQQNLVAKAVTAVSTIELSDSEEDEEEDAVVFHDTVEYSVAELAG